MWGFFFCMDISPTCHAGCVTQSPTSCRCPCASARMALAWRGDESPRSLGLAAGWLAVGWPPSGVWFGLWYLIVATISMVHLCAGRSGPNGRDDCAPAALNAVDRYSHCSDSDCRSHEPGPVQTTRGCGVGIAPRPVCSGCRCVFAISLAFSFLFFFSFLLLFFVPCVCLPTHTVADHLGWSMLVFSGA